MLSQTHKKTVFMVPFIGSSKAHKTNLCCYNSESGNLWGQVWEVSQGWLLRTHHIPLLTWVEIAFFYF